MFLKRALAILRFNVVPIFNGKFLYYYISLFDLKKILRLRQIPILNPSLGHTFGFSSL